MRLVAQRPYYPEPFVMEEGSLARWAYDRAISKLLTMEAPYTQQLYSSLSLAGEVVTGVRNTNSLLPPEVACSISAYRTGQPIGKYPFMLVTQQHVFASHVGGQVGDVLAFVDPANVTHYRTIVGTLLSNSNGNFSSTFARLDSPLPSQFVPIKIAPPPEEYTKYLHPVAQTTTMGGTPGPALFIPAVNCTAHTGPTTTTGYCMVYTYGGVNPIATPFPPDIGGSWVPTLLDGRFSGCSHSVGAGPHWAKFAGAHVASGGSNGGVFIETPNGWYLAKTHFTAGSGSSPAANFYVDNHNNPNGGWYDGSLVARRAITPDTAIALLGGGYTLSRIDLSNFKKYT